MKFEKHITKFEVHNQCFLLEDLNGVAQNLNLPSDQIFVACENKIYPASIRDFYVNGKFKTGIYFDHEEGHTSDFFFDIAVTEGRRAIITYEGKTHQDRPLIDIVVYVLTKS
ncbi:MAG: hypothetical protein RML72_01565 [Bacteroidia bacterium]|nr:hypothetical protein [Bacteroidia bacterium]MDW8157547.1 hypothetical protein [Bacteroidia bacterium]